MTRGTRRLAWLVAVFALAAVPIACSGFSSEETATVLADGATDSSPITEAAIPNDASSDAESAADATSLCSGDPAVCTDFSSSDSATWGFTLPPVDGGATIEWRSEADGGFLFVKGVEQQNTFATTRAIRGSKYRLTFDAKIEKDAFVGDGSLIAGIGMFDAMGTLQRSAVLGIVSDKLSVNYVGLNYSLQDLTLTIAGSWVSFAIDIDLSSKNPVTGEVRAGSKTSKFSGQAANELGTFSAVAINLGHNPNGFDAGGSISFDNVRLDVLPLSACAPGPQIICSKDDVALYGEFLAGKR